MRKELTTMGINSDPQDSHTAQAYGEVASKYDSFYGDERCMAEDAKVMKLLRDQFGTPLDGHLLDIGCGTGLLLDNMGQMIAPDSYLGVDISQQMTTEAKRKHPDYSFVTQNILHWKGQRFKYAVALYGVCSYIPLDRAFEVLTSHLTIGGKFFLMLYSGGHTSRILPDSIANNITYPTTLEDINYATFRYRDWFTDVEVFPFSGTGELMIVRGERINHHLF